MRNAALSAAVAFALAISTMVPISSGQSVGAVPVASLYHPVNVSFTSHGIILSYRHNDSATLLARLETNGTIHPYQPSFTGVQEVYLAEANGSAGFRTGDLFICSGDTIYRMMGGAGSAEPFATPMKGSAVEYVAFASGPWRNLLYALTGDGSVWAVNSSGGSRLVTNLGNNLMPEGLAVAPTGFGAFAGDLLVTMENSHNLVAIPANATGRHITLETFPNQAPERVLIVMPGRDLLIAKYDQGAIVEISARSLSNYVGRPMVTTEGERGQTGSVSVLSASGTNVTSVNLLTDPSSPHFEGAAFVPSGYITTSNTTTSANVTKPGGNPSSANWFELAVGGIATAVAGTVIVFYLRRIR